jgi:putative peptide zinc metalloprotease protein
MTDEQVSQAAPSTGPTAGLSTPLPRLREDLKLYPGAPLRDGSPSWRVLDPVRNAFFEIGLLEFELLARWSRHREGAALLAQVAAETKLAPEEDELRALVEFLAANQLLRPDSKVAREALGRKASAGKQSWYLYLLHHYLFFRLPLLRPDAFLGRTVGVVDLFFTRGFLLAVLLVLVADLYLVVREWHEFSNAFLAMLTPKGLVYYGIALTFAKVIHELGHAYAAKRFGVRVPAMGLAFLVMWPYLYTDVGETWKLGDRRKQFVIAAAGMAAELSLAVFATLAWALAPEGAMKAMLFVLATSTWLITLAINASPFMRFDGYFLLSDALDFPNLHERATACGKWWVRTTFFRLPETMPEPGLDARQVRWLVAFALVTWIYRLTVFFGIAVAVYFMFFKLLGILLMLVEVIWFIVKPFWSEAAYLLRHWSAVRFAWRPIGAVAVLGMVALWLLPVASEVTAPGLLRAEREQVVYAPFAAQVVAVSVPRAGGAVAKDAPLVELDLADLKSRTELAHVAIASAQAELARTPASEHQQERRAVLEQQLQQAQAEMQSVREDAERQHLRAAHAGTVRDLPRDLVPGQWVGPRQLLMRVVSDAAPLIEAFVSERQLAAITTGQTVRFYSTMPNTPMIAGTVVGVDRTPIKEITQPLLASTHGGDILVNPSGNGAMVANEAVFRVSVKPQGAVPPVMAVTRGTVHIEGGLRFVAENFLFRSLSVLIRESGF